MFTFLDRGLITDLKQNTEVGKTGYNWNVWEAEKSGEGLLFRSYAPIEIPAQALMECLN
jgi:hypothetical protein